MSEHLTAEELLKAQTVGLVHLSDFRKRRAEALERTEGVSSTKPRQTKESLTATKKRKKDKGNSKAKARTKLSFASDDDDDTDKTNSSSNDNADQEVEKEGVDTPRLGPNSTVVAPRMMTKNGLAREAQERDRLRREFLAEQELVKATPIVIPFVFFNGTVHSGGRVVLKKGDNVWLCLDRARKLAAELGGGGERRRREWARIGVDDLMLVRGEMILPHHYDFYYFMANKSVGYQGRIFDMAATPTPATPDRLDEATEADTKHKTANPDTLEGAADAAEQTRVVDRRWYDRNKHLFPASLWEEFDPTKDYSTCVRTDAEGNAFFMPS